MKSVLGEFIPIFPSVENMLVRELQRSDEVKSERSLLRNRRRRRCIRSTFCRMRWTERFGSFTRIWRPLSTSTMCRFRTSLPTLQIRVRVALSLHCRLVLFLRFVEHWKPAGDTSSAEEGGEGKQRSGEKGVRRNGEETCGSGKRTNSYSREEQSIAQSAEYKEVSLLNIVNCRSQVYLEKIEEMLERCNTTLSRCTRLLYSGKRLFGQEDMYTNWL